MAAASVPTRCCLLANAITGNEALSSAIGGEGGGVEVNSGSVYMMGCTVDHNVAQYTGGVLQFGGAVADTVTIINSTISGNQATHEDGGIFTEAPLTLQNSTVAFNTAGYYCAGVRSYAPMTMQSSIVANNLAPSTDCMDVYAAGPIAGANNLVTVASIGLPEGTIIADPRLTPLADHGGPTWTHGLSLLSPAVDHGSNLIPLATDQRGTGFARDVGATDIGAFERQPDDDEIFYGGLQ